MRLNSKAISAVWKRQLGSLLGNPLGYIFILAYVLVSGGFLFIPNAFFARNIADLGVLLEIMPWLLVILVPAIGMGSWASERELGTDEQLLTLPLSETDALVGKWLAVASFFTLALACSISNVIVLIWLGDPDLGMVFANYASWWFAGLVFAAISVLASVMVSIPAIAFVLGAFFCALAMLAARSGEWFDPFNRGLISIGSAGMAAVVGCLFLGLAVLVLSSRRWQKVQRPEITVKSIALAAAAVTLFNLSVQFNRFGLEIDVTEERLSSLSPASVSILNGIKQPVTIAAFISKQLPPELALKEKEVESVLKVLERKMKGKLTLKLYRPSDPLDEAGSLASQHYGLKPSEVVIDTVTGREEVEVFLGVAVMSGASTQRIDHFDPGLSVEYELVRTIRTVAVPEKKVVGIVDTDFDMMGGFDYQTRQMRSDWQVVEEWRKQYEIRQVNMDVPVGDDVDVLVAPQPSSLTEEQLHNLHDYIWNGRPALVLEDPLPLFTDPNLGSSRPRKRPNPMFGGAPPEDVKEKCNIRPFLSSIGLNMELSKVAWSDFNPSHLFRKVWPNSFVWSLKSRKGILKSAATTGIESVLLPWPGLVTKAPDINEKLKVKPLITPIEGSPWGKHDFNEHFSDFFFGMQKVTPQRNIPQTGPTPHVAVEITGKMKRAYPLPDSETSDASESDEGDGAGKLSKKPIHVIFVADTDFAHDEFFKIYRNKNNQLSEDDLRFLLELQNVQFLSNAVDALAGDKNFLGLRTRRPKRRPLEVLEKVIVDTQKALRDAESTAKEETDNKIKKLRDDFQERLNKISQRTDLDDNAKKQLRAQVERSAQRSLDADIEKLNHQKSMKIREAKITQQRAIEGVRDHVRRLALGLPALLLACLAAVVFANRKRSERLIVPKSRQRGVS